MDYLQQTFNVRFEYKVYFTEHLFSPENPVFRSFLESSGSEPLKKILFVVDSGVAKHHPGLEEKIREYFAGNKTINLVDEIMIVPGGEGAKNNEQLFYRLVNAVDRYGIDRHSYIAAVGGGSVLDVVGFAAAVSHRGIRHIRIPTTVLSQNDSGVGVKNGINYGGKKNFLGSFAPPCAVFNDCHFLTTLSDAEWRAGMSEAVKVALIKDSSFFSWLEEHAAALHARDMGAMKYLVKHCAHLHMQHIASGDPFEMGSSRPLDFGHWSAHKLEQLSNFTVRHGEAVALGIALDSAYSHICGWLTEEEALRIIRLIHALGLETTNPLLDVRDEHSLVLKGLDEFREHLGGRLTIMLLRSIGKGEEVNTIDVPMLRRAGDWLKSRAAK